MSQAPIMPFYTDAYLADTHHLSTVAHGAYLLLLLHTWRCNGVAPVDDDRLLSRITKLPMQQWKRVRSEIEPFFNLNDNYWRQKRLQKTWDEVQKKIESQRAKGAKGNAARKRKKELSFRQASVAAAVAQDPFAPCPSINHDPLSDKPFLEENNGNNKEVKQRHCEESDRATRQSRASGLLRHDAPRNDDTPHNIQHSSLTALSPILSDISYFVGGRKPLSDTLQAQIPLAQEEITQLLTPINDNALNELLDKLWRLFPKANPDPSLRQDYILWFEHYPADLIESACEQLLRTHLYPTLPRLADFASIMDPLMRQRQMQQQRLEKLATRSPT